MKVYNLYPFKLVDWKLLVVIIFAINYNRDKIMYAS